MPTVVVAQTHPGVVGDAQQGRAWLVRKLRSALSGQPSGMFLEMNCWFLTWPG